MHHNISLALPRNHSQSSAIMSSEMGLVARFERLGFPYEAALRLVSVLFWIQHSAEIPDLLNIILSSDDTFFVFVAREVGGLLGFLYNHVSNPASVNVSNLQTLVASIRNGCPLIIDLLGDREKARASVDENYMMLLKGKGVVVSMESKSSEPPQNNSIQASPNDALHQSSMISSSSTFSRGMEKSRRPLNPFAPPFVPVPGTNRTSEDERCLYLTFSKGHPLSNSEIATFFRELFESIFGGMQNPNPVETVYVHKGEDDEVALFGKIVFSNPLLPDFILGRRNEIKFVVNEKTLWCKRFVPKIFRKSLTQHHQEGESSQAVVGPQGGVGLGGQFFLGGLQYQGFGGGPQGQFQGRIGGFSPFIQPQGVGSVVGQPVGQLMGPIWRSEVPLGVTVGHGYGGYYHGMGIGGGHHGVIIHTYPQGYALGHGHGGHVMVLEEPGYGEGIIYGYGTVRGIGGSGRPGDPGV